MDGKTQNCLKNCVDRFIDANLLVTRHLEKKAESFLNQHDNMLNWSKIVGSTIKKFILWLNSIFVKKITEVYFQWFFKIVIEVAVTRQFHSILNMMQWRNHSSTPLLIFQASAMDLFKITEFRRFFDINRHFKRWRLGKDSIPAIKSGRNKSARSFASDFLFKSCNDLRDFIVEVPKEFFQVFFCGILSNVSINLLSFDQIFQLDLIGFLWLSAEVQIVHVFRVWRNLWSNEKRLREC